MPEKVGVPSVSGVKESMISYALGMGGGLVYGISTSIFGSGLIGGLIGAGIAGSTIKGVKGEIIATVLGFQTIMSAATASNDTSTATASRGVM